MHTTKHLTLSKSIKQLQRINMHCCKWSDVGLHHFMMIKVMWRNTDTFVLQMINVWNLLCINVRRQVSFFLQYKHTVVIYISYVIAAYFNVLIQRSTRPLIPIEQSTFGWAANHSWASIFRSFHMHFHRWWFLGSPGYAHQQHSSALLWILLFVHKPSSGS